MEGPITFDVWADVVPASEQLALELLSSLRPELSRLAVLQALSRGKRGCQIELSTELGWTDAQTVKSKATGVFGNVEVYQSGYTPAEKQRLHLCALHSVLYAGSLGCPVCDEREKL